MAGYRYPEREAAWRAANAEKVKAAQRAWYEKNKQRVIDASRERARLDPEGEKERLSEYRRENKEKCKESSAASRAKNPHHYYKKGVEWRHANSLKLKVYFAKRRASKTKATPVWADDFVISEIYDLAKRRTLFTGIEHHVDHIVPLKSRLVCGLHCESNLRVIPCKENISKGNRFWPDMP